MELNLESLERALSILKRAIVRAEKAKSDEELRDAVILRFEYSYELSWKTIKRQLEKDSPSPSEIDQLSFKDLMREAAERGLIESLESWFLFREARNLTYHSYNAISAQKVYTVALQFLPEAENLLLELKGKN